MTRETRIGLLVGLGLIIMFGLVLTELTGTAWRPPCPVEETEEIAFGEWAPEIQDVTPLAEADGVEEPRPSVSTLIASVPDVPEAQPTETFEVSDEQPEPLEASAPVAPVRSPVRMYTVRPDDSLIKIAGKVYGPGHWREYKRIFEANRYKLADESTLMPGEVLVIPPLPPASGAVSAGTDSASPGVVRQNYRQMDLGQLQRHFASGREGRGSTGRVYLVRHGDNLTKIARSLLNDDSPAAVRRIFDANRDKLDSPDCLPVGVRLQIPG